jgi:Ni,Fe-hydrogenase III component G
MKNFKEIEVSKKTLRDEIKKLYKPDRWHFITVNGTDTGDGIEVKYFFAPYGVKGEVVALSLKIGYEETLPSIRDIIPSAWIAEEELKDLLGINVEGAKGGIFLEPDSPKAPLRKEVKNG